VTRARFVVTNNLQLGTDVHWHGITVPNDMDGVGGVTQDLIGVR
jgi:manganese oxidase